MGKQAGVQYLIDQGQDVRTATLNFEMLVKDANGINNNQVRVY
jgi:hypothetical protein